LGIAKFTGLVFICGGLAVFGCSKKPEAGPQIEPTVSVIHPEHGAMAISIELPGDLVGFYEAALHAKVTGYLKAIAVDKGDRVKAGETLALIQVPELHSNLERAQATLAVNKITYERLKRVQVADRRLIAQEDVDIANAKYQQAQASVHTLETMVGYTRIVAPFDGIVTGRFADPGALVRAGGGDIGIDESSALISPGATEGAGGHRTGGGPLLTIAKVDRLRVYVYVPGRWCRYIRSGTPATLKFDEVPGLIVRSSITRYAGALDLTTRTMLAEIDINNPNGSLYPRMYARVKLDLVSHRNALRLPVTAVNEQGKAKSVFLVKNDRLVKQSVMTGLTDANYVEITSGLTTGDLVVGSFSSDLRDGGKVRYTVADSALTEMDR
jgi:membrane fusion protein (multidrug efflux system)